MFFEICYGGISLNNGWVCFLSCFIDLHRFLYVLKISLKAAGDILATIPMLSFQVL
jgi:hypothetical protein